VAGAHSWYKHLPSHGTVPFVFYLDPHAGWSESIHATGEVTIEEITDESDRGHYTWQTTADYRRRFGHWNYDVDTAGEGASVADEEGNWIAVPRRFLEAGRADVNAFMHGYMINWFWRPEPGEEPPKFLNDPAAAAFGKECGPPDGLAKPFQSAVDERLRRAAAALDEDDLHWFGEPWFDESWEEAFAAMGGTGVELDTALSWFQRRLLVTWAQPTSGMAGSAIPMAFAYERHRQLDEMRFAMLRVLDLVDGCGDDTSRTSRDAQRPTFIWTEWEGNPPSDFGHGVKFHDKKRGEPNDIVAFVEGFDWLKGNPKQITIHCIKPDAVTTRKTLDSFKKMIEEHIRKRDLGGWGQLLGRSRRLYNWMNC
jgi:hypothetical protein